MKKMTKVLFLAKDFQVGMRLNYFGNLIRGLCQRDDFKVDLVYDKRSVLPEKVETLIPSKLRNLFSVYGFAARKRLEKIIQEYEPDIIHYADDRVFKEMYYLHQRDGLPAVVSILESFPRMYLSPFLKGKKNKFKSQIVTVSDVLREHLVNKLSVPKNKISIINYGLEIGMFKQKDMSTDEFQIVAGCIGNFVKRKGQADFIRAAKNVTARNDNIKFILAGGGPEEKSLRRMAEKMEMNNFLTFVGEELRPQTLLPLLDILVVPSIQEGLGSSVIEAMACGLPVVATDVGGVYTLVQDSVTGFLVPRSNPDAIAEKIVYLTENRDVMREMGHRAREKVENFFAAEKMVSETVGLYKNLIDGES